MLFRPEWSDGLGPWRPGKDEGADAWTNDRHDWEPPRAPPERYPPLSHDERLSMWRRAFDVAAQLPIQVVCGEMESECFDEGEAGAEAARGWRQSIRAAQAEGLFDERAARSFIAELVNTRLEVPDLTYDMLWEQWHDLRVGHGFPPGEAFRESPGYPQSAGDVDAQIDARYEARVLEILGEMGEVALAAELAADFAPFDSMTGWTAPPALEAKEARWRRHDKTGWCFTGVPWPDARHVVFDAALASAGDPVERHAIGAVRATLLLLDAFSDWPTDRIGVRDATLGLSTEEAVRAPLLRFVDGLRTYDDWDESPEHDARYAALVEPFFAIAESFERCGRPLLAPDLYWTIEGHGSSWQQEERALAARKRIERALVAQEGQAAGVGTRTTSSPSMPAKSAGLEV